MQAGQRKTMMVNQFFHPHNSMDVRFCIEAVVGPRGPFRLDEAGLFIFADSLLGQADPRGNLVDQISCSLSVILAHHTALAITR